MRRLFSALLVFCCFAASCTAPAGDRSTALDQEISESVSDEGQRASELAFTDSHSFGELVRLALVRPVTYRPQEVALTDQSAVILADLLYDGLTETVGGEGRLRPGLATSWRPNDDFTVWRFEIDPAGPASAKQIAEGMTPLIVGSGSGAGRAGVAAVLVAGMRSVSTAGDRTVVVELERPNAGLPWILSGLPYSVVGRDGTPTGDYELISDDSNGMILQRRPGRDDGNRPVPAEIHVSWIEDEGSARLLLSGGSVDAAIVGAISLTETGPPGGPISASATGITTSAAIRFYVMNSRSDSLVTVEARRTVLSAVSRAELVSQGFSQPVAEVDGLVAPSLAGYSPTGACGSICRHEPSDGKGPGGEELPRLQVSYTGYDQEALAAAIVDQLESAGFRAERSRLEPNDLASVIVSGETDLFAFGWVAPATSLDALVPALLQPDSPANIARIDSVAIKELLDSAALIGDDQQRWAVLSQAHRLAMAEALIIPIAASVSTLVRAPTMQDLPVRADGSIDLDSPS